MVRFSLIAIAIATFGFSAGYIGTELYRSGHLGKFSAATLACVVVVFSGYLSREAIA